VQNGVTSKDEEHDMRLADIRARIARGEYRVEPRAVAEAIVCRVAERAACAQPPTGAERAAEGRRTRPTSA
jgi:hypothetical protein